MANQANTVTQLISTQTFPREPDPSDPSTTNSTNKPTEGPTTEGKNSPKHNFHVHRSFTNAYTNSAILHESEHINLYYKHNQYAICTIYKLV